MKIKITGKIVGLVKGIMNFIFYIHFIDEPKEQFSPNSNSCCKDDVVSSRQELQMKNQGPRKQNLPRYGSLVYIQTN